MCKSDDAQLNWILKKATNKSCEDNYITSDDFYRTFLAYSTNGSIHNYTKLSLLG